MSLGGGVRHGGLRGCRGQEVTGCRHGIDAGQRSVSAGVRKMLMFFSGVRR